MNLNHEKIHLDPRGQKGSDNKFAVMNLMIHAKSNQTDDTDSSESIIDLNQT